MVQIYEDHMTDGKCTVSEFNFYIGNLSFTGSGSSKRMKGDTYDHDLGVLIASTRALEKLVSAMKVEVRRAQRPCPVTAETEKD